MKPIWPALLLLTAVAVPARAQTESRDCIAAIKTANSHHRAGLVPADCWRFGPLALGAGGAGAENLLGPPDATGSITSFYRRRKFALDETLYVYPRNLANWLRLAPQPAASFPPTVLSLFYWKDALVAVSLGRAAQVDYGPPCVASRKVRAYPADGADFPYDFHGVALGSPVAMAAARFGRFASVNASRDFANYWPVPLALGGEDKVAGIEIASGMAFVHPGKLPEFHVQQDPHSCLVTGYMLETPH